MSQTITVYLNQSQMIDVALGTTINVLVTYIPGAGYSLFNENYSNSLLLVNSFESNTPNIGGSVTKTFVLRAVSVDRNGYFNVTQGRQFDRTTWQTLTLSVSIYTFIPVYPQPNPRPRPEPRPRPRPMPHPIPRHPHGRLY